MSTKSVSLVVVRSFFVLVASSFDCNASDNSGLRLPTFVDSHMVLQRAPHRARLWGWANPGTNVTAQLNGPHSNVTATSWTTTDVTGAWLMDLPPQSAGNGHAILLSDGTTEIFLEDIAFGDVFLCSGQSNMEMSVPGVFGADQEIQDAANYPNLRLATVALDTADIPQMDAKSKADYKWARSSPASVGGDSTFSFYSATCYFFGRELYLMLDEKVPIGLVTSAWGGQKVETFSSADALNDTTCGGTRPPLSTRNIYDGLKVHYDDRDGPQPTQLWNAMIHPLLPMRFTGAVWYQGEANDQDPTSYSCRFPAMIADWRNKFGLPDLFFLYVELAGYAPGQTWPELRAAQEAALQLPGVGVATAMDLSDPDSPAGSIHPRRKQEVGRRLAVQASYLHYGEQGVVVSSGPKLKSVQFLANENTHSLIQLGFEPGSADELHLNGTASCSTCCHQYPFFVLDSDGNWSRVVRAQTRPPNFIVLLSRIPLVMGIRYNWEPMPECAVYNFAGGGPDNRRGLPARPFEWCAYPSGQATWTGQQCMVPRLIFASAA